ncbi:MAG: phosphoribosylaminoimidazole carboxylase [Bacteroidales bacterium]|nr:phosphoribosylaminoimidazole carboxylase [Bacteroidales bacterium]
MKSKSIFSNPNHDFSKGEFFETLFESSKVKIERIISKGNSDDENIWYNQDKDEWVILIQGSASIAFENDEIVDLKAGEHLFIPHHKKHRVAKTSAQPECIWIGVHADFE